jgi:nucleoside-diphosphate-sugar epimerase
MKIVVTGASGNFGREFTAQARHDVIALNREDWGAIGSILSNNVDVVIHAASDLKSSATQSPSMLLDSNVMTTAQLLEAMRTHKIPRLLFMSSCAVYGDSVHSGESSTCQPSSINGISKLLSERVVAEFCGANSIKYGVLRVFNMYGGVDHFSILSHLRRALHNNQPFTLNNAGIAQRDFIHVSDVVGVVLRLLSLDSIPVTLNVGTGIATKISTLVDFVKSHHPALIIKHEGVKEAEYSRANVTQLRRLIDFDFQRLENYLADEFLPTLE